MKILVVGNGGREHSLIWKIKQSPLVDELYCAPGNAGTEELATNVEIKSDDIEGLRNFAKEKEIDLTVVGPELPIVKGITNEFIKVGLKVMAPTKEAAVLEGSKIFCKNLLRKYAIPTAAYKDFDSLQDAISYAKGSAFPLVVKADGLAQGKGSFICQDFAEAKNILEQMMLKKVFGVAGERVLIEEFLTGKEVSVMALTDSKTILVLETAQDYKRIFDRDEGPNTGGMGSISPSPFLQSDDLRRIEEQILVPVVHAMKKEKRQFRGVLYAGLMLTKGGPKVLEFNVRFGDPELESLLVRLESDIVPVLNATVEGKLDSVGNLKWDERKSVCVVVASKGYPQSYETGFEITGLANFRLSGAEKNNLWVFHAGTKKDGNKIVSAGGRVLQVVSKGKDYNEARQQVYNSLKNITFANAYYRTDIGIL